MSPLVPCPTCSRHVRASEKSCPFCTSLLPESLGARALPGAPRRLERLAAFTFAAAIAATACATADDGAKTKDDDLGTVVALYGMPPEHPDAGPAPDAAPTPDAGAADAAADGCVSPPDDDGGIFALYGAPTLDPCAPVIDAGGVHAMYGMPPDEP